jgi:hypothetical protein
LPHPIPLRGQLSLLLRRQDRHRVRVQSRAHDGQRGYRRPEFRRLALIHGSTLSRRHQRAASLAELSHQRGSFVAARLRQRSQLLTLGVG